jgi:hypothetical protein
LAIAEFGRQTVAFVPVAARLVGPAGWGVVRAFDSIVAVRMAPAATMIAVRLRESDCRHQHGRRQ